MWNLTSSNTGGHLAFRAAFDTRVAAAVCYFATDIHSHSLGAGKNDDSLQRAGEIRGEVVMVSFFPACLLAFFPRFFSFSLFPLLFFLVGCGVWMEEDPFCRFCQTPPFHLRQKEGVFLLPDGLHFTSLHFT